MQLYENFDILYGKSIPLRAFMNSIFFGMDELCPIRYSFLYTIRKRLQELNYMYDLSRHAKVVLLRDSKKVVLRF